MFTPNFVKIHHFLSVKFNERMNRQIDRQKLLVGSPVGELCGMYLDRGDMG
jgi:hypothetical protein